MKTDAALKGWSLEVVRGKDVGRAYPLDGTAVVLGNELGFGPGIDLADQEGGGPRRMAAKQAQLEVGPGGPAVRDLDSPGGTFVNRQRILPGQARSLNEGDVLQLGGVQLKLVRRATAAPSTPASSNGTAARPEPAASRPSVSGGGVLTLRSGVVCRTWDEVLTVSAQRWAELRDELTTGRLAAGLLANGQARFAPSADAPGTPDERLDTWLGSLPLTRKAAPELDLHPATLVVRVTPGGGITRRTFHVANAGYRLLRAKARVEPSGTGWLSIGRPFAAGEFAVVDSVDVPVEITIPDTLDQPRTAVVAVESNGGQGRVTVRLEAAATADLIPEGAPVVEVGWDLREALAGLPFRTRLIAAMVGAAGLRLAVGLLGGLLGRGSLLPPAALLLGVCGVFLGARLARKRGGWGEVPAGGFAGGFAGVLLAEAYAAIGQTIEPLFGVWLSGSAFAMAVVWAGIGALIAWLSGRVAPAKEVAR